MGTVAWQEAWQRALYGPTGFYRGAPGPAGHFTTATHGLLGQALAGALVHLARGEGCTQVVDVGCGRGELLAHLHEADPGLRLTGVDVVDRPAQLPEDIGWVRSPGGAELPAALDGLDRALVVAHEWLDVVPCAIAEVDSAGTLREVLVDEAGREVAGRPLTGAAEQWCRRHWPATAPGERVEVGLARDQAWSELLSRVRTGLAVAIDYGHRGGERPRGGTLAAYRRGTLVAPVPDGSCDLTAHVAVDSLDHDELLDQRTALRGLGVLAAPPVHALATTNPQGYLRALSASSASAALTARGGFGDFWWVLKRVG